MYKFFAIACLFYVVTGTSLAQTKSVINEMLKEAVPESAGVSSERLRRIDQVIQQYIDSNWLNGAVAIFVRNGKIVYYKALGYEDISKKTLVKKDAIFRIASQTKAVTSLAVMMLYEEGKFLLDDPVSKYIPAFRGPAVMDKFNEKDSTYTTVPAAKEITIRHLLTHTSGIDYPVIGSRAMKAIYAKADISSGIGTQNRLLATEMKKLAKLPLAHQPGEKFTYGLSTDLLGYLVEVLSGTNLDEFFKKRIFDPLGMKDTYFNIPSAKQNRLATLYTEDALHHLQKSPLEQNGQYADYPNRGSTYFSGGAGLSSTAYDYAIFLQMMLNGGFYNGRQIISRSVARMMTINQVGDLNMGTNKFGLGFSITSSKGSADMPLSEGSFSWGGYFSTTYWADPIEEVVGQIMTQVVPNSHGELGNKFKVLVYQALNN